MSDYYKLYMSDMTRYGGKPESYIKIFLYLLRRASVSKNCLVKKYTQKFLNIGLILGGLKLVWQVKLE